MPVVFYCSGCQKRFTADDDLIGKRVRCKNCGLKRVVPETSELQEIVEPWVVSCTSCHRNHYPKPEHEGKRIRCRCGQIMRLTRGSAVVEEELPSLVPLDDTLLAGSSPLVPHAAAASAPVWSEESLAAISPGADQELPSSFGNQVAPPRFNAPTLPKPKAPEDQREARRKRELALIRKAEKEDGWRRKHTAGEDSGAGYGLIGVIGGLLMIAAGIGLLVLQFNNPDEGSRVRGKGPVALIIGGFVVIAKSVT